GAWRGSVKTIQLLQDADPLLVLLESRQLDFSCDQYISRVEALGAACLSVSAASYNSCQGADLAAADCRPFLVGFGLKPDPCMSKTLADL
ncbi:MAG: hypothetical protein RL235_656, partial [Chlamydiota bacterium]